jgi:hypothetical protein
MPNGVSGEGIHIGLIFAILSGSDEAIFINYIVV